MLLAVGGNPRTIVGMLPGEVCPTGRFDLTSRTSPEQDDDVQDVIQKQEYWNPRSKLTYCFGDVTISSRVSCNFC